MLMSHAEQLALGDMHAIAREWLIECFPESEDEILDLSAAETQRAVHRYYDGGWKEFLAVNSD